VGHKLAIAFHELWVKPNTLHSNIMTRIGKGLSFFLRARGGAEMPTNQDQNFCHIG
jgi:hypothetical protein